MKLIPQGLTRTIARQVLVAKKNSPHIFFAGGVVGVLGSTFLACRSTLKLEENVDEIKADFQKVKDNHGVQSNGVVPVEFDQRAYQKDLLVIYGKSAKKIGKLYGPPVILGAASIAALANSHVQMTRRNAALTATLSSMSTAFDSYRSRVREEIGEKREEELYHCMEDNVLEIDGKKTTTKALTGKGHSQFAVLFDAGNANWENSNEYNLGFIIGWQNYWNSKLQTRGHVFLNEVYDKLGFEHTPQGQLFGWVRNKGNEETVHIDFGLDNPGNSMFMMGRENNVWLDFNVNPRPIYDVIGR